MIDSTGTLADGSSTSALNYLVRSGNDAFTWRSVNRTQAGQTLPDLPAITVKRAAAGSADAPIKLQGAK